MLFSYFLHFIYNSFNHIIDNNNIYNIIFNNNSNNNNNNNNNNNISNKIFRIYKKSFIKDPRTIRLVSRINPRSNEEILKIFSWVERFLLLNIFPFEFFFNLRLILLQGTHFPTTRVFSPKYVVFRRT